MHNKSGPQNDVLEHIKLNISAAEDTRKRQRLEHNLAKFIHGDVQVLKNEEFIEGLTNLVGSGAAKEDSLKGKLLICLGEATIAGEFSVREKALTVSSLIGEQLLKTGDVSGILSINNILCMWLRQEKEMFPGAAIIIKRMEALNSWLLQKSIWKEGEKAIVLFRQIENGETDNNPAYRSLVSSTLEKFAHKATLERLTEGYLLADENQSVFRIILLFFEYRAAVFLMNRLIQSMIRKERLQLLQLLPAFGSVVMPILEECLKNNPPWAVTRNVLCILADVGNDSCYPLIRQYFRHEDQRVQYEMICCVHKLGGPDLISRLLEGLEHVNDELKIHIIQILVEQFKNNNLVPTGLYEFLENRTNFAARSKNRLVSASIAALKSFPSIKGLEILRNLQHDYSKIAGQEQMQLQIEEALKFLAPKIRHRQQRFKGTSETITFDSDPQQTQKAITTLAGIEENLRKLVRAGDMSGAGQMLNEQALAAARSKDFLVAEKLRDRLLEINPMALAEAVALGELIEEEKSTSRTSHHHLGIWSELYEDMATEEFNALYTILRQEEYRKGDIIVKAGETDDVLYFLNSGYVSLNCLSGGNVNFLKRLGVGSIVGADQFFSASVWTVTLRAISDAHLQVLDHSEFMKLEEDFPKMEENLRQYCQKYADVPELLKMSGDERREFARFPVAVFTQNVLLDPYGNKGKRSFKGELLDISRNGLAFIIKISSRTSAKLLLGRQIFTKIQTTENTVLADCSGIIVGVKDHNKVAKDFTVHVKLSQKIDSAVFAEVIAMRR